MIRLLNHFETLSRRRQFIVSWLLVGLVGGIDYLTGSELSFSIFYLVPITLAAWFRGRRTGLLIAAVSAILWLVLDLLGNNDYFHPLIPYWNALVRFGFFLIVTYALSALRQARQRQEELGHFIVHDLRSPLSTILMALEMLQADAGDTLATSEKDLVQMCIVSSHRMMVLINSLLDLARLESGKMPLQLTEVSVKELVDSAIQQISVWAGRSRITVKAELDSRIETVYADSPLTARILANLLSNALKFSPPDSVVTVRVVSNENDTLAFSVIDQGPGIPSAWVGKIFDKFAQVETKKSRGIMGSGIGLAFCRLAVEAQDGRIWLESEVNRGTAITFTLPVTTKGA